MYQKRKQLLEITICLIDAIGVVFSIWVAGMLRYESFDVFMRAEELDRLFSVLLMFHVAAFYFLRVFEDFFRRGRYKELLLSIKYNFVLVAGTIFLGFSLKEPIFVSRLVMGYFLVMNILMIWLIHLFMRNRERILRWNNRRDTNLLVVTTSEYVPEIVKNFQKSKETIWNIVGIVLLDYNEGQADINEISVIHPDEDEYLEFAVSNVVDEVFICVDAIQKREKFLKHMILEFEKMGVVVNLNLDLFNLGVEGQKRVYKLDNYNVLAFSSRLFDYRMILLKRMIDVIGALVGLVITFFAGIVLAPFLLAESPGPLIFKQKRIGVNGRVFEIYKFRSMYVDAEDRKKELLSRNEMEGPMFKMENDPRVTKVGAFIRKTSIDELPQFWNVLKGDMSLVGTRPPTLDEYRQYSGYQKRRISFRPGITGLWQIRGRSNIKNFDEVVKLDLEYIDNWSLLLDLKIMLKTIPVVFIRNGAE